MAQATVRLFADTPAMMRTALNRCVVKSRSFNWLLVQAARSLQGGDGESTYVEVSMALK